MRYVNRVARAIRMPTRSELDIVLRESGKFAEFFRDHMLIALPAGLGLRPKEVRLLDCGDVFVYKDGGPVRARARFQLRDGCFKKCTDRSAEQMVTVPRQLQRKLIAFARWKERREQPVAAQCPLFSSRQNGRISARRIREIYQEWSKRCDFHGNVLGHGLRHRYCTSLYQETHDLRLVAAAARHTSTSTTEIYVHVATDEIAQAVERIRC